MPGIMVIVRWQHLPTWIYCILLATSSQMVWRSPADLLCEVSLSRCVRDAPAHRRSHRKVYASMTVVRHEVCWVSCYTRETQSLDLVQRVKSNQAFPFCLGLTRFDSAHQPLGGPVALSTSPHQLHPNKNQDILPLGVNVQSWGLELSRRGSRLIGPGPYFFYLFIFIFLKNWDSRAKRGKTFEISGFKPQVDYKQSYNESWWSHAPVTVRKRNSLKSSLRNV